MRTQITLALAAAAALAAGVVSATPALADSSVGTGAMGGNGYRIEAHAWKDPGNASPHWQTSAWTFHGSALQSVTRIRDTADLYSNGGGFTYTCSVGFSGQNPTGSCSTTGSISTNHATLWWENGNTYESEVGGQMMTSWNTLTTKVCATASAYSQPLGIHGTASTCVGWG